MGSEMCIRDSNPAVENPPEEPTTHIEQYMVAARLKSFRKPKSQVRGDIPPDLVTKFHDQLAVPLTFIFNQALTNLDWPTLWKAETVAVIPKNGSPAGIGELRNLSCTPLFSKVLESFVLDRIKSEVTLSEKQYGGCLLYTSPSPRDLSTSRMPSSA